MIILHFKLAFIGFGTVGQGLSEILLEKEKMLDEKYGFQWTVVAISDFVKGSVPCFVGPIWPARKERLNCSEACQM